MKKILITSICLCLIFPLAVSARGGSMGGRVGGIRSSSVRSSAGMRSPSVKTPRSVTSRPSTPKVSKPSSATKTVKAPTPKTVAGKTYSSKGYVVDNNYQPKFSGGYAAPAGSTIYYRQSSIMDWLPFYMIMSSNNAHREAVVTQPDGQEKIVKEEGTDTMYVVNWIITILFAGGIIWLIVYLLRKKYKKAYEF